MSDDKDLVYDESSFKHFEGTDAVRERFSMYIQSSGPQGIFRCVQEIAGNSLDEFRAGRATKLVVHMDESNSLIRIDDDGSGIPIGKIVSAATELHSGAKFGSKAYKYSIGLNGVGLTCTNATADWCKIEVRRDHKKAVIEFRKGKISKPLEVVDYKGDDHGTSVTWIPDITVFGDIDIDVSSYKDYFEKLSYINNGVKIELNGKLMNGKEIHENYYSKNGMIDYLRDRILVKHKLTIPTIIEFPRYDEVREVVFGKSSRRDVESQVVNKEMGIELCFTWVSDVRESSALSFVNGIQTTNDGAHVVGVRKGIANVIRKDLKGYLTKKDPAYEKFVMDDFFEGWTCVLLAFHDSPIFDGQTKNHFTSDDYEPFAEEYTEKKFLEWSRLNPARYKAILNQIVIACKARLASLLARNKTKGITQQSPSSLLGITKYCAPISRKPEERELFIVEGESAGGSAKSGRNCQTQAIYMLMGKPRNMYGAKNIDQIVKREGINPIGDLVKVLGCGYGKNFDIERLMFNKIIIMADADADGGHISSLLLAFIYCFMPDLIRQGHVYVANPPLFRFGFAKGKNVYIPTINVYNRVVDKTVMKEFDLYAYGKKGMQKITNQKFFHQFLINLRGFSSHIETAAKQVNMNPELFESFIVNYNDFMTHNKFRVNGWELEKYHSDELGCDVIEGIYDNVFHKIEITDFFLNQCSKVATDFQKVHWSNLVLKHKKSGKILGPGLYKMSHGIEYSVNKSADVTRFKGLGEMSASQLWETTMNPETRTLNKITMDDSKSEEIRRWMDILVGDDIQGRKEYYRQYL